MTLLATFHIIEGLVALSNDDYFLVGQSGLAVVVILALTVHGSDIKP